MTDFAIKLQQWFTVNKRELPWRMVNDPYKVWLSEIILQQTQVVQGESYYLKFVDSFPTVFDLASASEDRVLRRWQGLGYYSRARNLHAAAKTIVDDYNGVFPNTFNDIIKLKGVGPYTAAAIASICFDEPCAVVDGNVFRFISRLKGISTAIDSTVGKKEFSQIADELLDKENAGEHNQAMMEMGALVCRPSNPLCHDCPFNTDCVALASKQIGNLPYKEKRTKQRARYLHFFLIRNENKIVLEKRNAKDIWKNLYQLPLKETRSAKKIKSFDLRESQPLFVKKYKHILSHQILYASFYFADKSVLSQLEGEYFDVDLELLDDYAFPQLVVNFLSDVGVVKTD
ncbi:A/G-specific adenine glycosylase [Carboxylicivirga marina]|uniref:Adenine DNA glycosylase n=1 Tax=Carboxylicivirga marina TaxID=2800988 RepID=A0ABS1HKG2_9BACT|nr:A/G-specific adenine glycosylase [Carboxylicivirga marina]MBK3518172.1 A/G-specific adenine glycosylase [Carboxylicivirga marina]